MVQSLNNLNPTDRQTIQEFCVVYSERIKVLLALGHKEPLSQRATWFLSAVGTNAGWFEIVQRQIELGRDDWHLTGVSPNHNVTAERFQVVATNVAQKINASEDFKRLVNDKKQLRVDSVANVQTTQMSHTTNVQSKCVWCTAFGIDVNHSTEDCYQMKAIKKGLSEPDKGAKMFRLLADIVELGHKPRVNVREGTFNLPANPKQHTSLMCTSGASNKPGMQFLDAPGHAFYSSYVQSKVPPGTNLEDFILLDCACDKSTFTDMSLVTNTQHIEPRTIKGIGTTTVNMLGESIFGEVLIVPDQKVNLLSQSQVIDENNFSLQYNAQTDSYTLYDDLNNFEFTRMGGLYAISIHDPVVQRALTKLKTTRALAATADGENIILPAHARERLYEARRLHVTLGHPSDTVLCKALDNDLQNTHLTSADVKNMTRVLGACPECIQGKTKHITDGGNFHPAKLPGEVLHMDLITFTIGRKQSMTAIVAVDEFSMYGIVKDIITKSSPTLFKKVMETIHWFTSKGAHTRIIRTDPECAFRALIPLLAAEGVTLDTRPVGEHEKHTEARIATLRDRMRTMEATMHFHLPHSLTIFLWKAANWMLNIVPSVRTGNMSPYTIIHERRPEVPRIAFGEPVLVTDPSPHTPTNNREMRADLAIFLGNSESSSTSGHFLILASRTIKQRALNSAKPTPYGPHIGEMLKPMYEGAEFTQTQPDRIYTREDRSRLIADARNQINTETSQTVAQTVTPSTDANPQLHPAHKGGVDNTISDVAEDNGDKGALHATTTDTAADNTPITDYTPEVNGTITSEESTNETPPNTTTKESRYGRTYKPSSRFITAYLCALARDIQNYGQAGVDSAKKEIRQILTTESLAPTAYSDITEQERDKALDCKLFIEQKRDGRIKSRFVGGTGASCQNKNEYPDLSSPTVRFESVALLLKVAAQKNYRIAVADVPGAYLHAEFQDLSLNPTPGKRRFVRVRGELAKLMGEVDPKCKGLLNNKGELYLQLQRALYGLIESAKLWYVEISSTLTNCGFNQYKSDPCTFNHPNKQIIVGLYVDDIIIMYRYNETRDWFMQILESKYGEPRVQKGPTVDYLNVSITRVEKESQGFPQGTILVSQRSYIASIQEKYPAYFAPDTSINTPYGLDLFASRDTRPAENPKEYVSVIMSLVYTCTRARSDIFLPISYLCTKAKNPTRDDERKLRIVCSYLMNTADLVLAFTPDPDMNIVSWIDASYAIHDDARGHTGIVISIGNNKGSPVFVRSRKQKLVTISSTEAELVALHDGSPQVIWTRAFLQELLYDQAPTVINQDNRSTIHMAEKGAGNFNRTKHIAVRYFAIKQLVEDKVVTLNHVTTDKMLADPLTKPIIGRRFREWRDTILFPGTSP